LDRPFCVPIVCQSKISRLMCACFREQHPFQFVGSTLLHVWQDVRVRIHRESD